MTTILIRAGEVDKLQLPTTSMVTGGPDATNVAVRTRGRHIPIIGLAPMMAGPIIQLPLDEQAAHQFHKYSRLLPWRTWIPVIALAMLLCSSASFWFQSTDGARVAALKLASAITTTLAAAAMIVLVRLSRHLHNTTVRSYPTMRPDGQIAIDDIDRSVAEAWHKLNGDRVVLS